VKNLTIGKVGIGRTVEKRGSQGGFGDE